MKKNIEWVREQIKEERNLLNDTRYEKEVDDLTTGILFGLKKALNIINQLDEPEVLSQEESINIVLDDLKEYIKEQQLLSQNVGLAHTSAGNDTHYKQYDYVLECISEYEPSDELQNLLVPKQELPVIPKYVADWIEENRERYENDFFSISCDLFDDYIQSGVDDWMTENEEKFLRAWLDGYTIAEEPLYYALIKGHELLADEDAWACSYWNLSALDGHVFPSDKSSSDGLFSTKMTKSKWNKVGINDSNADFVKVEEDE